MYFKTKILIDPAQVEKIERVKPQKAFKKLLYLLTKGGISDKEVHETFCAILVLQQLNEVLQSLQVNNIIRLTKDNFDYYFDESGLLNDFESAMDKFETEVDPEKARFFEHLYLVLEHPEELMHMLIEIQINRINKVGQFPITLIVNGIFSEFDANKDEDAQAITTKLQGTFRSQENYEEYLWEMETIFNSFLSKLEEALHTHLGVKELKKEFTRNILRPKSYLAYPNEIPISRDMQISPLFHGYFGINKLIFYAWIWGDMCYENNIFIQNTDLVDEQENILLHIDEDGLNEEMLQLLNTDVEFKLPSSNISDEKFGGEEEEMSFSFTSVFQKKDEDDKPDADFTSWMGFEG